MKRLIEAVAAGLAGPCTDSRRLFHGRGHTYKGLEGVNVDVHPPLLLVTLYSELAADAYRLMIDGLTPLLVLGEPLLVQRRYLPRAPSELICGELPEQLYARHGDLRYLLSVGVNQNVGYFLDMKPTHQWLAERAKGLSILNLFSYTCAFSVNAIAAGARSVVNIDMSGAVLKTGQRNHALNQLDGRASRFMKLNILKSWGRIKKTGPFDIVIIDPPSNQRGSFMAETDYEKVLRRIPQLVKPGGMVLACLNAPHLPPQFLQQKMQQNCPECVFEQRLPASAEFPELEPERSLKAMVFRYQGPTEERAAQEIG